VSKTSVVCVKLSKPEKYSASEKILRRRKHFVSEKYSGTEKYLRTTMLVLKHKNYL